MRIAIGVPGSFDKHNLSASGFKALLDLITYGLSNHNTIVYSPHGGQKILNISEINSTECADQYSNTMLCAKEFAAQMSIDHHDGIIACTNMGRFLDKKHIYLTTTLPYKLSHRMLLPEYPDLPHYNKLLNHLKFLGEQEKTNYDKAELIITCSDKIKAAIITEHNISPEKIHVLPYPITHQFKIDQTQWGYNSPHQKLEKQENIGKNSKLKIIIMPQELRIMKGIKDAIETMKLVKKSLPNAVLVICGKINEYEKPLIESLLKESKQLANIILAGFLPKDQFYKYLNIADCAFLPVLCEGQCVTISECIASGLPVVTNEFNQYPEKIINLVGHFSRHRDIQDYAQGIIKLLTDPDFNNKKRKSAMECAKLYSLENFKNDLNHSINTVWKM